MTFTKVAAKRASSSGVSDETIRISRRNLQYEFTTKHHGGNKAAARWLPDLSLDEEFSVFDLADFRELADEDGALYGLLLDDDSGFRNCFFGLIAFSVGSQLSYSCFVSFHNRVRQGHAAGCYQSFIAHCGG